MSNRNGSFKAIVTGKKPVKPLQMFDSEGNHVGEYVPQDSYFRRGAQLMWRYITNEEK